MMGSCPVERSDCAGLPGSGQSCRVCGLDWFGAMSESRRKEARIRLGIGTAPDFQAVLASLRVADKAGNAEAALKIGEIHEAGTGDSEDAALAIRWFRKACKLGVSGAGMRLAQCYIQGHGCKRSLGTAIFWLMAAADQGDEVACAELATKYADFPAVRGNAEFYLQRAAELGHAESAYTLGERCLNPEEGKSNPIQARKWFEIAAAREHAGACGQLGEMWRTGEAGLQVDFLRAVEWYERGARAGDADSAFHLGCCHECGEGVQPDLAQAAAWYRRGADSGSVESQFNLANMYSQGRGVAADQAEAARWYRKASQGRHPVAQFLLSYKYQEGEGVNKNPYLAFYWLYRSALGGDSDAQHYLGRHYEYGNLVPVNYAEAVSWYELAAEKDCAEACLDLSLLLSSEEFDEPDDERAVYWMLRGAELDNPDAQYLYALRCLEGDGVPLNRSQAKVWLSRASLQGHDEAATALRELR